MFNQVRVILPGARCNLRCKYCINDGRISGDSTVDYDRLYNRLSLIDVNTIGIWGGEPLANPKLEEVLRKLREWYPKATIYILSNGTLLNDYFVGLFNELDVSYSISHDGRQQYLRTKDFLQERSYIERLKKLKKFDGFNCVISRHNCNLVDAYRYICKEAAEIPGNWQVTFGPFELSQEQLLDYMPSVEQYQQLYRSYKEIMRMAEAGEVHLQSMKNRRRQSRHAPAVWRCGAERRLTIDCAGRVYQCQVAADSGEEYAVDGSTIPMMCAGCKHVNLCRGICPFFSDHLRKKLCLCHHLYYDALQALDKEDSENASFE